MNSDILDRLDARARAAAAALRAETPSPRCDEGATRAGLLPRRMLATAASLLVVAVVGVAAWVGSHDRGPTTRPVTTRYLLDGIPGNWSPLWHSDGGHSSVTAATITIVADPTSLEGPFVTLAVYPPEWGSTPMPLQQLADARDGSLGDRRIISGTLDGRSVVLVDVQGTWVEVRPHGLTPTQLHDILTDVTVVDGAAVVDDPPAGLEVQGTGKPWELAPVLFAAMGEVSDGVTLVHYEAEGETVWLSSGFGSLPSAVRLFGPLTPVELAEGVAAWMTSPTPQFGNVIVVWEQDGLNFALSVPSGTALASISVRPATDVEWAAIPKEAEQVAATEGTVPAVTETTVGGEMHPGDVPPNTIPPLSLVPAGDVRDVQVDVSVEARDDGSVLVTLDPSPVAQYTAVRVGDWVLVDIDGRRVIVTVGDAGDEPAPFIEGNDTTLFTHVATRNIEAASLAVTRGGERFIVPLIEFDDGSGVRLGVIAVEREATLYEVLASDGTVLYALDI